MIYGTSHIFIEINFDTYLTIFKIPSVRFRRDMKISDDKICGVSDACLVHSVINFYPEITRHQLFIAYTYLFFDFDYRSSTSPINFDSGCNCSET